LPTRGFLRPTLAIVFALAASIPIYACSPEAASEIAMAPMSDMPSDVQAAPVAVRQAYQFAVANPDVVKGIPCYCGCGAEGHTSNYSCYIAGQDPDGSLRFDQHALGCSICVDITRDAMGMLGQGKTIPEIRAAIDQTYSRYGPSNMP